MNDLFARVTTNSAGPEPRRRRVLRALALIVGLTLVTAGCNTLTVSSNAGVLSASSGNNTSLTWFFFNQDFKNFAATRTPLVMALATSEYEAAIVDEPGSKFFSVRQQVDSFSETTGSGAATQVLLKANEFANQGDGLTLSPTENITINGPAYGFSWLTVGSNTRVTTVVPSDLCDLFVMVVSDGSSLVDSAFYGDVAVTTTTYSCSGGTKVAAPSAETKPAGPPGIFLSVNPVLLGREVHGSPIYFGADRVGVGTTYLVTVSAVATLTPSIVTLAEGTIDAGGSFTSVVKLPPLSSGRYNIRMTGTNADGNSLELTCHITVGDGVFSSIGNNAQKIS